jgi:tetratricopeptide (TPR) repeat protein
MDRPYIPVATLYAFAGQPAKARQLLARFQAEDAGEAKSGFFQRQIAELQGEIALAEGKAGDALPLFRKADVEEDGAPTQCDACTYYNLGRAFDKAGQTDSAQAYFEKYLAVPAVQDRRLPVEGRALATIQKRLGEIYDSKNERQKAIEHYAAFVDQWSAADPDVQPVVASVRKRLTELRSKEGR